MIFDAIAGFLMGILNGVLGLIPTYAPDFQSVGFGLGGALAGANSVFPVTVLGGCLISIVGLRIFLAFVNLVTWVYAKIPFLFR